MAMLVCLLLQESSAGAADLSPGQWPQDQRLAAEKAEATAPYPTATNVVEGKAGLVAATLSPIAALAGVETLKRGGTAADAAAATALTQISTALGANVSYAGILELVYFEAKTGRTYSLNAGWNSWRGETEPATIPTADMGALSKFVPAGRHGGSALGRMALVPGFMAGIEAMQAKFGKLKLADALAPAIWYAEKGVTISPLLNYYFGSCAAHLAASPSGQNFLRQAGGDAPRTGEHFIQSDLAKTLRAAAKHGAREMYAGQWARDFVAAMKAAGGKASLEDLKHYEVQWSDTASSTLNGYELRLSASSLGAQQIREALNLIDADSITKQPPYLQSADTLLALSRILTWVSITSYSPNALEALRATGVDTSPAARLTPAYARAIAPVLATLLTRPVPPPASNHSAAVVVVDQWGNVAALVHSSNSVVWGSTGIVVGGVPIPDAGGVMAARIMQLEPGQRVPNEMSPVIVLREGRPVLGVATIGVSLIQETVRVLLEALVEGNDVSAVMAAPPLLLTIAEPSSRAGLPMPLSVPEKAYNSDILTRLRAQGVTVVERPAAEVAALRGTAAVVHTVPQGRSSRSAEVPGVSVFAAGY
jgi:gamma-glutamyltranspeptidase/glutathione hydrolase